MKWTAIILLTTIIFLFYLMSDRGEQESGQQTTPEKVEQSQDDSYEQEPDQPAKEAAWQNQRAEKIIGLGTGIN